MKIHILDDWYDTIRRLPAFELLSDHEVTVWTDRFTGTAEQVRHLESADAIVLYRDRTAITESLAQQMKGPKLIAMRGQHGHVDVEALTRAGILFCSKMAKDGPSISTAELTFGLIISALRYLPEQIESVRAGQWQKAAPLGRNVSGKTLGLYGYGGIARVVSGFANQFGMRVQVWASEKGRARAQSDGLFVPATRQEFFTGSDVVSIHKRLTPTTRQEISLADLRAMVPGSVLVNTSRSGLIESGALLSALEEGRIGRAAVDVFDDEPVTDQNHPLLRHKNVIPTPHIGFVTAEELNKQFGDVFRVVNAFSAETPTDMINPEVWVEGLSRVKN